MSAARYCCKNKGWAMLRPKHICMNNNAITLPLGSNNFFYANGVASCPAAMGADVVLSLLFLRGNMM